VVKSFKLFLLLQFALATLIFSLQPLNAKELIKEGIIKVKRAHLRTPEEVDASEAMLRAEGKIPKSIKIPFRPALNKFEYKTEKDAATSIREPSHVEKETKNTTAPSLKEINIEGVNQTEAGGSHPPDTHGAVGIDHFVEVTNQNIDIYEKNNGNRVESISLASFFGYTEKDLFDPRCVYDHMRDREYMAFLGPMMSAADVEFANASGYLSLASDNRPLNRNLLSLLNVKYVVSPPGIAGAAAGPRGCRCRVARRAPATARPPAPGPACRTDGRGPAPTRRTRRAPAWS